MLRRQRLTQGQIAAKVRLSQQTVARHLAVAREEWREASGQDFDAMVREELRRLNAIELELSKAYETAKSAGEKSALIGRCLQAWDLGCRIQGLYRERVEVTGAAVGPVESDPGALIREMDPERAAEMLTRTAQAIRARAARSVAT